MPSIFDELSDDTTIEPKHETSTLMDKPDMIPQLEDLQVPAPAAAKKKFSTTSEPMGHNLQAAPASASEAIELDTLKAQILQKISEKLKPKTLAYENYSVEWYVPQLQTAPLALSSTDDYKFLLEHALKREAPTAIIVIQTLPTMKKLKHSRDYNESGDKNQSNDGGSKNSSSEDDKPKKKSKKDKKSKSVVNTILNEKITSKIVQLQNRWLCLKAGCSSNHCFIHPEHPDHFPL
ncbi:hypothetical protein EV424DRAFT_1545205 [Suillus variegatus]|nr:hypothetical protein EV424DRAFT_1545205 [Suillus variegatus]